MSNGSNSEKSCSAKVVLITGASRGIGASIANKLAENDYIVYAGVRENSVTSELISKSVQKVILDVTNDVSVQRAITSILEKEGRIDVLINNAGIMLYGSHENTTIEEAKQIFEVNYFGPLRVTHAVLPFMRQYMSGHVIQIGSRSGFRPLPSLAVYADSKAALLSASQTLAATLTPWNIKVSVIEPGPVVTDLDSTSSYGSHLNASEDPYKDIFARVDLQAPEPGHALCGGDAQQPEDIAAIVLMVIETAEPALRYQTTENIRQQAARRAVDRTGNSDVRELRDILFER